MAHFVFGDLKNCKVIINGSAAAGSKRKIEEDNDNSTILLTLRESVRNLIPFVIHLIESGVKREKKDKKICKFQDKCKKKNQCKFPHVPEELPKDLTLPYYLCYKHPNCDREVSIRTLVIKLQTTKRFI